jgi:hypothetical protein
MPGADYRKRASMEAAPRKLAMGFCSALRRRETEHTETRKGFGLERVVSGGRSEQWWGAKLDHRWISQQHYAARLLSLVSKT